LRINFCQFKYLIHWNLAIIYGQRIQYLKNNVQVPWSSIIPRWKNAQWLYYRFNGLSVVSSFYLTVCKHVEVYTTWFGGECIICDKTTQYWILCPYIIAKFQWIRYLNWQKL
jgi:hypothetical protein